MATTFQAPAHALYTRSTSVSPSSTPTTPTTSSPSSPHSHTTLALPSRPPRPLYVPAVLRPSRPPRRKPSPPTSSPDLASPPLTRSNSDAASWHTDLSTAKSDPADPPSRDHWKPDAASSICDAPACTRAFTYFTRRHHCRRCGDVFCDAHSARRVPLSASAALHPSGRLSRACDFCWGEWMRAEAAAAAEDRDAGSRAGSRSGSDDESEAGVATPGIDCVRAVGKGGGFFDAKGGATGVLGGQPGSVAASVPRDWNWSTF